MNCFNGVGSAQREYTKDMFLAQHESVMNLFLAAFVDPKINSKIKMQVFARFQAFKETLLGSLQSLRISSKLVEGDGEERDADGHPITPKSLFEQRICAIILLADIKMVIALKQETQELAKAKSIKQLRQVIHDHKQRNAREEKKKLKELGDLYQQIGACYAQCTCTYIVDSGSFKDKIISEQEFRNNFNKYALALVNPHTSLEKKRLSCHCLQSLCHGLMSSINWTQDQHRNSQMPSHAHLSSFAQILVDIRHSKRISTSTLDTAPQAIADWLNERAHIASIYDCVQLAGYVLDPSI